MKKHTTLCLFYLIVVEGYIFNFPICHFVIQKAAFFKMIFLIQTKTAIIVEQFVRRQTLWMIYEIILKRNSRIGFLESTFTCCYDTILLRQQQRYWNYIKLSHLRLSANEPYDVSLDPLVWYHYRPQRSCGKVMFSQASVILFTWGVSARHPPGQTPPLGRHPRADTPPSRHPPDRHHPHWENPHPLLDRPPLGRHLPQQMATAADGMDPTGMHSCFQIKLELQKTMSWSE